MAQDRSWRTGTHCSDHRIELEPHCAHMAWQGGIGQEPLFAARVVYDLLFYFIVIIIVLNLIFGVIIDTFADLRSEKQKKEEILKTTCFICGMWEQVRGKLPDFKLFLL
ncbi:UNVERIFIED_CONTAM: Inositol 1,4,5-trisphosphate receptor type 2 [Gekko kuhli]